MSTPPPPLLPGSGTTSKRNSIIDSPALRGATTIPDDEDADADLPLTMAASVILTQLPKDAKTALEGVNAGGVLGGGKGDVGEKVTISFHPIASAPRLPGTQTKFRVSSTQSFMAIVKFLRKKLGLKDAGDGLFCYVNQCFAPGLDEGVGGLWACFKTGDELTVHYAVHPAFG